MNSDDRARWLEPSAAIPVDGDARPEPDAKATTPDTDVLSEVLKAMRWTVDERRETTSPEPSGLQEAEADRSAR
jgi:hypothetical protein